MNKHQAARELIAAAKVLAYVEFESEKDQEAKGATILDVPDTRQTFPYDCGAKATQTVLAYYGIDVREDRLLKYLGTTEEGTDVKNIIKVLKRVGLEVEAGKMTVADLEKHLDEGHPIILPLQAWVDDLFEIDWQTSEGEGHYVICVGMDGKRVYFEDPATFGKVYLSKQEFLERWHDKDEEGNVFVNYGIVAIGKSEYDHSKFTHMG